MLVFDNAIEHIRTERLAQDAIHGERSAAGHLISDSERMVVLLEEVLELCRAHLKDDQQNFNEEVVQVAAVSTAMVENRIERGQLKEAPYRALDLSLIHISEPTRPY